MTVTADALQRHGFHLEQSRVLRDVADWLPSAADLERGLVLAVAAWHADEAEAAWQERQRLLEGPSCDYCASPIEQPATGRPRRFCNASCRSAGRRR